MKPGNKRLRGSSSGSESPAPKQATGENTNMASKAQGAPTGSPSATGEDIAKLLADLKHGQEQIKRSFESKIDKLKNDINASISDKLKALKDDIYLDMGKMDKKIDELDQKLNERIDQMSAELSVPNGAVSDPALADSMTDQTTMHLRDTERCIIAMGVPYRGESENLDPIIRRMVNALDLEGDPPTVLAWSRMKQRSVGGRPPLLKIAFADVYQKIRVLKNKAELKKTDEFKNVWLRSSQTHTERLLHLNFKKMLKMMPQGKNYRLTGSGRLVQKTNEEEDNMDAQNAD